MDNRQQAERAISALNLVPNSWNERGVKVKIAHEHKELRGNESGERGSSDRAESGLAEMQTSGVRHDSQTAPRRRGELRAWPGEETSLGRCVLRSRSPAEDG